MRRPEVALDHLLQQRLVVALVEEEHLVARCEPSGSPSGQLLELAGDELRHQKRMPRELAAWISSPLSPRLTMLIMQKSQLKLQPSEV